MPSSPNLPDQDDVIYDYSPKPKRRVSQHLGWMGTLVSILVLFSIVIVVTLTIFVGNRVFAAFDFLDDPIDSFLDAIGIRSTESEPTVFDVHMLVLGIREMALLHSASGAVDLEIKVVDKSTAPDSKLTMKYIGLVDIGIDLEQITEEDVSISDGHYTVTLPPLQVFRCALLDPRETNRSCLETPIVHDCGRIFSGMRKKAYEEGLNQLREKTVSNEIKTPNGVGILNVAENKIKEAFADLIVSLTGTTNSRIYFTLSEEDLIFDASCFPLD